ncbi:MAG: lipoyl(octanoyl) transferase LipB [Phycisphaerae bacterium]|nr:lipoyl(octanoyl) transferase LipB [Phycisphaerae bacterium]
MDLQFIDLGRVAYAEAYRRQLELHEQVLDRRRSPVVLLLEHDPPVITLSKRATAAGHLLADSDALARDGIEVHQTNRGGDITYHGPGQLVVYPIVHLDDLGLGVRAYVRLLEQVAIDTLGRFQVEAGRDEGGIGVWVGGAKIAAVGVRIRRRVSLHGLAVNVDVDLAHFGHIVPCGLDRPVTSLRRLLGGESPELGEVRSVLEEVFRGHFGRLAGSTTGGSTPR